MTATGEPESAELVAELVEYVGTELLGPGEAEGLTGTTPLLEWGVLNSIKSARLVAHIRNQMGIRIPPESMTGTNFRDLASIARLIDSLRAAS
ncbi:acyl carrier protein [Nocardia sp. NPDC052112]|uniref:acyl carrier protein n=1 Tax=Nocardia sp. NPDC052112 TaxID=3155646 RepID=UPI00341B8405